MSQDRNKSIIKRIYVHSYNNSKNNQTVVASLLNLLYFVTTIKASNQYCRLFHSSAAMLLTTSRRNKLRMQAFSSTKHALVYLYWYLSPSIPDLRVLTTINPVKFHIEYQLKISRSLHNCYQARYSVYGKQRTYYFHCQTRGSDRENKKGKYNS